MIGRPGKKSKKAAREALKAHKKAARFGVKAHKKVAKYGVKVAKSAIKNPGKAAAAIATGGLTLGGTAGKVARGVASGGMSFVAKKLFGKKNTNVGKASKAKRRERIDTREGAPSEKVVARRAKTDAADTKRFGENEAARTRINKKIEKQNKRLGRDDKTYKDTAKSKTFKKDKLKIGSYGGPATRTSNAKKGEDRRRGQGAGRVNRKKAAQAKIAKLRRVLRNKRSR
jgi:hypothetical protein